MKLLLALAFLAVSEPVVEIDTPDAAEQEAVIKQTEQHIFRACYREWLSVCDV